MQCKISFEPAVTDDGEGLAIIRVEAMRESLERVGRFDPRRARDRFLGGFSPSQTFHVQLNGERAGFYVLKLDGDDFLLDHLYIRPIHQSRGLGAAVLAKIFELADLQRRTVRVGALRESASNRFYMKHGFVFVEQTEFDNFYVRKASNHKDT